LDDYSALGAATGGAVATAVVSGPGGVTKALRRGETLEGWRLVAVDRSKLTFERNGLRRVIVVGAPAAGLAQAAQPKPEPTAPGLE